MATSDWFWSKRTNQLYDQVVPLGRAVTAVAGEAEWESLEKLFVAWTRLVGSLGHWQASLFISSRGRALISINGLLMTHVVSVTTQSWSESDGSDSY